MGFDYCRCTLASLAIPGKIKATIVSPAPLLGWTTLLAGLVLMFLEERKGSFG